MTYYERKCYKMKKILSFFLSLIIGVSALGNAYAYQIEEKQLIQVGEYMCYEANGQYFTEIDGETFLVINLDCKETITDNLDISTYSTDWMNGRVVDISDGSYYSDTMNASKSDDCTPIIVGKPTNGYKFSIAYLPWVNNYNVNIHYYDSSLNIWRHEEKTLTFIMEIVTYNILFTASASQLISKICVEFYNSSTGRFPFTYRIQQC